MVLWRTAGLLMAILTAGTAFWRTLFGSAGYYESAVYGMTRRTHTGYALAGLALALLFAVSYVQPAIPVIPLAGAAVLLAIFYFTSFLRGFSDEE